jgi:hypothetical protein
MNEKQITFLSKLAPMAVRDWNENHIVIPSITIAQGIHESGWGTSELAVKANNLFGIKANNWNGPTYDKNSGEYTPAGQGYEKVSAFRVYPDWGPGVKDHSVFLSKPRYAALHGQTDFCLAAHALKLAGYATGPFYSRNIVQHILDYKLYKYDPVQPDFNAIYRVQTNAFNKLENAQIEANKLKSLGFNTTMIKDEETGLIFVQVGAYRARDKACDVACQLILKGYKPIIKVKK